MCKRLGPHSTFQLCCYPAFQSDRHAPIQSDHHPAIQLLPIPLFSLVVYEPCSYAVALIFR